MTDPVYVTLRSLHILGATIWAGGTLVLAGFHEYVIDPGEPERTIQRLAAYDRMSTAVGAAGIVGIAAGLPLYWIVSGGLSAQWMTSAYGAAITTGAVAALGAFLVAIPMVAVTNERSKELHAELQSRDLSQEDAETIQKLFVRLRRGERAMSVLLGVAILAMAAAQSV